MLHGNIFVLHPGRFIGSGVQGFIQLRGHIDFALLPGHAAHLGQLVHDGFRALVQRFGRAAHFREQLGNQSLRQGQQRRKQMGLLQLLMPPLRSDALGQGNGLHGFLRVLIVGHCSSLISGWFVQEGRL